MKVLLACHGLAPGRGSEPGIGWNWAWSLAQDHDVWAIAHPEFRSEVDAFLAVHPNPRLRIVWLSATSWDPTKGMGGFHWHYLRWLRQAQEVGRSLHETVSFDLVHHVSLGTISAPPDWWKLGIPFVWGPIGGAQVSPPVLRGLFEGERWQEQLRALRVGLLRFYPRFRTAVRRSAAVLATNHETRAYLQSVGGRDVPLFLDGGVAEEALSSPPRPRPQPQSIRVLWASNFERRKALPLALEAVALMSADVPVTLVVAGGADIGPWQERAAALGIADRVEFVGKLSPVRMKQEFERADIFLFTSIRDSFGTVVLEASTHGLPIVSLDHQGIATFLPAEAGIKVPVGRRAAVTRGLGEALSRLARDPAMRHAMGTAAWQFSRTQLWPERAARMTKLYARVTSQPSSGSSPLQRAQEAVR